MKKSIKVLSKVAAALSMIAPVAATTVSQVSAATVEPNTVPQESAPTEVAATPMSTSVTHGETGLSEGQSSASTNRIHSSGRYRVHIVVYHGSNLTVKVFRYGSEVHSFTVSKGNNIKYFNGTGDYSVRVYNNSKKSALVGVDIDAA